MPINKVSIEQDVAVRSYVEQITLATKLLPHPSKVLSNISKTIQVFDTIRKQPDVAGVLRRYRDGIKRLEWDVTRQSTKGDRAAFFQALTRTWNLKHIIPAAITAREYGYTVFERNWQRIGGKILPVTIVQRPRHWFRFDTNNQLRLITKTEPDGIHCEETWPRKFVAIRHEASDENPYGEGLLDEIYWLAKALSANFEYHLGFLEDFGRDRLIGWVPPGTKNDERQKTLNTLVSLHNAACGVFDEGTRIEFMEIKGRSSSSDAFDLFKKSCLSTINILVLGSDLATNSQGTGAYASTQSGIAIEDDALDAGKELVEELINRTYSDVAELNALPGNDDEEIEFILKKPVDAAARASIIKTYADATGRAPSDQLLAKEGFDPGDWTETATTTPITATTFESGYDIDALTAAIELVKKKP